MDSHFIEEIDMLHRRVVSGLGDPKRLMMLYVLAAKPLKVGELAAELEMPPPTVSRHLAILRERSLVQTNRAGTSVYYSLTDHRVIEALDLLCEMVRDRAQVEAHLVDFTALDAQYTQADDA